MRSFYSLFFWVSLILSIVATMMVFGCIMGDPARNMPPAQLGERASYHGLVGWMWFGSVGSTIVCAIQSSRAESPQQGATAARYARKNRRPVGLRSRSDYAVD